MVWQRTSPLLLNRRAHELRQSDQVAFRNLTQQKAVADFLVPSLEQLRIASCCCPILGKSHIALAQLAVVSPDEFDELSENQTAVRLAPNDAGMLFRCGILDIHAGRMAPGLAKLKKCLSISTEYLDDISTLTWGLVSKEEFLSGAVPDSPERIVEIARRVDSAEMRKHLTDRAAAAMLNFPVDVADEAYLLAVIAKLQFDTRKALEQYKIAVDLSPEKSVRRFEFAELLAEQGQLSDAYTHASICVRQAPGIPAYRLLLKRINELRRARQ